MANKIICDVTNCIYNKNNSCTRKNIRVLTNTPNAKGGEGISCMSFRTEDNQNANRKPELADANRQ
ncbi:MAG: DUF1540 domain-containing protein [Halanaerobiaceae bacterium]